MRLEELKEPSVKSIAGEEGYEWQRKDGQIEEYGMEGREGEIECVYVENRL